MRSNRSLSTIALFGATAIVAQVLLLRECLVVVAGNEMFIALFFGCWFIGIAAGAAIGSAWKPGEKRLVLLVPAFLSLQVVLLPVLMISLRDVRARWDLPAWQLAPFFALLRIGLEHLCPFSFLTGLTFPMLCRLVAAADKTRGRSIGLVYAVESLGSLIGGAVVTFVFVVYCEPLTAAWLLGALTTTNLVWFSLGLGSRAGRASAVVAAVLALGFVVIVASPIRTTIERWSAGLRHRAYGEGFDWLAERSTPYQHLALAHRDDQYSLLSNGRFIASFPDPYAVHQRVHLMMSQCERARRVLVIGGGESGALTILLLYPGLEIDYVETDPQVLALVRPYLEERDRRALSDPRVHIFHEDARHFVARRLAESGRASGPLYDAILCNTPDPSTAALNRFYTWDFFLQARRLLGSTGVFVTSISSGVNYFDRELLDYVGSIYEALVESFGHVLATPGTQAFFFATAKDDLLTSDVAHLIARYEQRGVQDPDFSPLYFHTAYESDQLRLVNQTFRRALGTVRLNTDLEPVTYLYYLRLWSRFSGSHTQRFFSAIERYNWRWVVFGCAFWILLRFVTWPWWPMTSDRAAYRHAAVVLLLTGAAGMVSSIVLLLLYQNLHGSLYRDVGLLVALFMAGLTVGSLAGNRIGRDEKAVLSAWIGGSAIAYGVFFFALESVSAGGTQGWIETRLLGYPAFFYLAMILAGVLTGLPFPLVGRLAVVCGHELGRAGGTLESLDHLGACAGAFLTGIVLIPISGIVATLKVVKLIELAAGISLLLAAVILWRSVNPTSKGNDTAKRGT